MSIVYVSRTDNFLKKAAEILETWQKEVNYELATIVLPNRRSCRELRKYFLKNNTASPPEMMAISDLLSCPDMTMILVPTLKKYNCSIPLSTLYELAESLSFIIKELAFNMVDIDQIIALVPATLQKYWAVTASIITKIVDVFEIKKIIEELRQKLETFLLKTVNIVTIGIEGTNHYSRLLLQKAEAHGIVITDAISSNNFSNTIEFLEFNTRQEEGYGVAVAVKAAIDNSQSVLIVSPDQDLSEIIKTELKRWNIIIDDSRGTSFFKTAIGLRISAILYMMESQYNTAAVLDALRLSPTFAQLALDLELRLRHYLMIPSNFLEALKIVAMDDIELQQLAEKIDDISSNPNSSKTFSLWFDICRQLLSILDPSGVDNLNSISSKFLQEPFASMEISIKEFNIFLRNHILSQPERFAEGYTPNVIILGVLEAQFLEADRIIVTSVSEESWTKSFERNDFWLTQTMLDRYGMQSIKMKNASLRNIFDRLLHKKNVLVTRATLVGGVEQQRYGYFDKITKNFTVCNASWLKELFTCTNKFRKSEMPALTNPNPALKLRPNHLWVSDIDLLTDDPYAFYAKRILKLPETNHINEPKNIRGNYMHEVLEKFAKSSKIDSLTALRQMALQILKNKWLKPHALGLWFFRLNKIFSFVINNTETKKHYAEITGRCIIKIGKYCEVEVGCRVDRIDIDNLGEISIIDYKSGQIPTMAQVSCGDKIQLPLEAIIAQRGGFAFPETTVKNLYYWDLKNLKVVCVASDKREVSSLATVAIERLEKLIHRYNVAGEAYKININSAHKSYLHLARAKEQFNV